MKKAKQTRKNKKKNKKSMPRKSWITPELIKMTEIKNNLYKAWQKNPLNLQLKSIYKNNSNKLCNIIYFFTT